MHEDERRARERVKRMMTGPAEERRREAGAILDELRGSSGVRSDLFSALSVCAERLPFSLTIHLMRDLVAGGSLLYQGHATQMFVCTTDLPLPVFRQAVLAVEEDDLPDTLLPWSLLLYAKAGAEATRTQTREAWLYYVMANRLATRLRERWLDWLQASDREHLERARSETFRTINRSERAAQADGAGPQVGTGEHACRY